MCLTYSFWQDNFMCNRLLILYLHGIASKDLGYACAFGQAIYIIDFKAI